MKKVSKANKKAAAKLLRGARERLRSLRAMFKDLMGCGGIALMFVVGILISLAIAVLFYGAIAYVVVRVACSQLACG